MAWPMSQDYNEAIQSPGSNFADPDLCHGRAAVNALGLPMPCAGNFADVYEVRCPGGARWAVKCFTRQTPSLRERYQEISRHLRRARLSFTVEFSFLDQGIRVAGQWYPVLKMQWVEGLMLNSFVAQHVEEPATLEALLQVWRRMARDLRAAQVGHCDLQHGNVLLVPGAQANALAVRLIDYDGMWVPALAGTPSGEVGHCSYQHPRRVKESTYSIEVDRFSVLLIATALRALAVAGRPLWEKFDDGDNLLFRQQDLEAPSKSALMYELLRLGDPSVRFLAEQLIDAARKPLDETPLLEELLDGRRSPAVSAEATRPAPAPEHLPAWPAPPAPAEAPLLPGVEAERRRRVAGPFWIALAAALSFFGIVAGIFVLVANRGGSDSRKGSALVRGDSRPVKNDWTDVDEKKPRDGGIAKKDVTVPDEKDVPPKELDDFAGQHGEPEFENSIQMKLALIPAGKFAMGSPPEEKERSGNESPRHIVEISRPFYMGTYLVTQEEYQKVMEINPSYFSAGGGGKDKVAGLETKRFPVEQVSWLDAVAFCAKLSELQREKKAGRSYRLPTEAEWEYACRARTAAPFYFGEKLSAREANFDGSRPYGGAEKGPFLARTTAVGSYPKNGFGLYDMHGNVWQWCNDWHDEDYFRSSPPKDPPGPASGPYGERSQRGGSWDGPGHYCRSACRGRGKPDHGVPGYGFRVVCVVSVADHDPSDSKPEPRKPVEQVGEIRRMDGHSASGDGVVDVAFAPDGRTAVSGGEDKIVRRWDLETGKEVQQFHGHTGRITCVSFTPDGLQVVSGSDDKTLRLWDVATGKELRRFEGHNHHVGYYMIVTADGQRIISCAGATDKTIRIWDLQSGKELKHFEYSGGLDPKTIDVWIAAFSADGLHALSGASDDIVRLWNVDEGVLSAGKGGVQELDRPSRGGAFSGDGRFALAFGTDRQLRLYDAGTAKLIRRFMRGPAVVHNASFSPDGQRVLTTYEQQDFSGLWDVRLGVEIYRLAGNAKGIGRIRFSPDGKHALTAGRDGTLRLWRLPD